MKRVVSKKITKLVKSRWVAAFSSAFFASFLMLPPQIKAEEKKGISYYRAQLEAARTKEKALRKEVQETVLNAPRRFTPLYEKKSVSVVEKTTAMPTAQFKTSVASSFDRVPENYAEQPEYANRLEGSKSRVYAVLSHRFATKMFGPRGERDDIAAIEFGSSSLKFSDIAFDVYAGVNKISSAPDEVKLRPFYEALNAFTINFQSKYHKTALMLGLSQKFFNDGFEAGFEVPVEQVHHTLNRSFGGIQDYRRWVDLYNASLPGALGLNGGRLNKIDDLLDYPNPSLNQYPAMVDTGNEGTIVWNNSYPYNTGKYFSSIFYNDLSLILDSLLTHKKITYKPKQTISGVGNIGFYVRALFEKGLLGVKVDLPCAKEYPDTLWKPELGNSGNFSTKFFVSYGVAHSSLFNPHMYAEVGGYVSVRKNIRLSQSYVNDSEGDTAMKMMLLSQPYITENFPLRVIPSAGSEVQVRPFASSVVVAETKPGTDFTLSLGNVMHNVFMRGDKLDVTYNFFVKDRDDISGEFAEDLWNSEAFRNGSNANAHKVGFLWTFYEQRNVQFELGGSYVVAGKNIAQQCDIRLRLKYEF